MSDPIVDEIRSTRERLAMLAGGDIHSIAMAARERQKLSGTITVTRAVRKPEPSRIQPSKPSGGSSVSTTSTSSPAAG
ncbi:MAG: hypothetical protein WCI02_14105 [Planctomycetota bacterium]|jgi:hypothetical protein